MLIKKHIFYLIISGNIYVIVYFAFFSFNSNGLLYRKSKKPRWHGQALPPTASRSCPTFCKQGLCTSWDHLALHMHIMRLSLGHWLLWTMSFTMRALAAAASGLHWSGIMVMLYEIILWPHYGYVVAAALTAVSARRKAVWWLLCQPGENKCVCSSYISSHLLPAS